MSWTPVSLKYYILRTVVYIAADKDNTLLLDSSENVSKYLCIEDQMIYNFHHIIFIDKKDKTNYVLNE